MRGIKSHARSTQGRMVVIFALAKDKSSGPRDEFTYRDLRRQTSSKENDSNRKINHNILMVAAAGDLVVRWTFTASAASAGT